MKTGAGVGQGAQSLPAAAVAVAALLALPAPAIRGQAPQAGSVTGRVTLTARIRGAALPTNTYSPRSVSVPATTNVPELRNVVVYVKEVMHRGALPAMRRQIRQQGESFTPRVVAITRGSLVDFPNGDPFFHNVFSLSGASTFDLGRYPAGQSRSRQFTKAGLVKVYCHMHSQMSASILVLDHPHFAMLEDDGAFKLLDVPPGQYTLVAWHERVGEQMLPLTVQPGHATMFEIKLPVVEAR